VVVICESNVYCITHTSNHLKKGTSQKCNEDPFTYISVISVVYKASLFHNLTAVRKFTCLRANVLAYSRDDTEGDGVIHMQDRRVQSRGNLNGSEFDRLLLPT
jgi:hypothetical protein